MQPGLAHALSRFGLGGSIGDISPADPRAWLAAQLDAPDPLLALPGPNTVDAMAAINREDAAIRNHEAKTNFTGDLFHADLAASLRHAVATGLPFRERLVLFWLNHFTVSARGGGRVPALLGAYVQEAIRPHVTGRFADMLAAVMRHPAMLYYLDNANSVGPDSPFGRRTRRGMNENLARECLELHTVGTGSGYQQDDVTSFAAVLTGWCVETGATAPGFLFRPNLHQPGTKIVMGERFAEGETGGMAALAFLASHPATYRRLATQLVRHFVADAPPDEDVARVAGVLQDTQGDLRVAALEVTRLPGAWQPLAKLRNPVEYAIAVYRALPGVPVDGMAVHWASVFLGQPFWAAPLPNGWPDAAAAWTDGEAMLRRADWAWDIAGQNDVPDPLGFAERVLGDLLGPTTRSQIAHASSRREAVALLLASPAFMRR